MTVLHPGSSGMVLMTMWLISQMILIEVQQNLQDPAHGVTDDVDS